MEYFRIEANVLKTYIQNIMEAYGIDNEQTHSVSEMMVWCDLVGRSNHGVQRLKIHMDRFKRGVLKSPCQPKFTKTADSTELLDGDEGFGYYIGKLAMNRAIELARKHGVGVVGVHNSNFFGIGAQYVNQAAQANMVGIALSNVVPIVTAHGGIKRVFGTNPFSFGAPSRDGRSLMLDMATCTWPTSKVREHIRKGLPVPEGVAVDANGDTITNLDDVATCSLLPFGGAKGYGLALMVEILSGVITGAGVSHNVASLYKDMTSSCNNGHFMMALDISRWISLESYYQRMESLTSIIKSSSNIQEVFLPGEKRWSHYEDAINNGVPIDNDTRDMLVKLSEPYNLQPPWT